MATIRVHRFDGGIADDIYNAGPGQFSVAKHFDTLTYPLRLMPLRGMTSDTASTGIGNIIVGSDNNFYGMGVSSGVGQVYSRATGSWVAGIGNPGDTVNYNLLVEYHDSSGTRRLITAGTNELFIAPLTLDTGTTHALTFTNIGQGFVHPKFDICYIPYDNKIAANNNGTWTDAALTLPANYRNTSLSHRGDYLAIAACPSVSGVDLGGGSGATSKVFLWDQNTSTAQPNEIIDWGAGNLKVLNNLNGVLIGISDQGGSSSGILDRDSIVIKAYDGGEAVVLAELSTNKQTSSTPDASINPRVNFVYRGRLYFSIDLNGGGSSPSYHGLWSIGKSKTTGRYTVQLERMATDDGSETSVLAAAMSGDVCVMVYDAEGTLAITNSTSGTGAQYTATSVYESAVNPEMLQQAPNDFDKKKQLEAFGIYFVPLNSSASVVAQYRVDGGSWTTIVTKTSTSPDDNTTIFETSTIATGDQFVPGTHYEFRITSTGGGQIVGYAYKYRTLNTPL